jgi:hypothetical protein
MAKREASCSAATAAEAAISGVIGGSIGDPGRGMENAAGRGEGGANPMEELAKLEGTTICGACSGVDGSDALKCPGKMAEGGSIGEGTSDGARTEGRLLGDGSPSGAARRREEGSLTDEDDITAPRLGLAALDLVRGSTSVMVRCNCKTQQRGTALAHGGTPRLRTEQGLTHT